MRTVVAGRVLNHQRDTWANVRRARSGRLLLGDAKAVTFVKGVARAHVLSILNQLQLGSCTGNGTAQAIRALQHLLGVASPALGSRLWNYYLGRWFAHDTANDDGAEIGNVVRGIELYGVCPETVWPYSDANPGPFQGPVPPEAWRAAYDTIAWLKSHRLDSSGDALLDDVRAALTGGRLVVFGSAVSEAFCQGAFDPTVAIDPPSDADVAGLHCECIGDFDDAGNFDVVNSWDTTWGNEGWWKAKPTYLLDKNTSDFYVFDGAPPTTLSDPA